MLRSQRFAGKPRPEAAARNSPPFAIGESSEGVATLQGALIDLGFPMPVSTAKLRGEPDGIYGSETHATVKRFQQLNNLVPDGVAGANTMRRLDEIFLVREFQSRLTFDERHFEISTARPLA
jgi:peptidoglycan hydrolase-like protein with peptidoglycan-binding domain